MTIVEGRATAEDVRAVTASWPPLRLSRILVGIKDGTHGTYPRVGSGGRPLLSAKNVQDGYLRVGDSESMITESDHLEIVANGYPRSGDLLLTIVGTIGRAAVFDKAESIAFQRSVCFLRFNSEQSSAFMSYMVRSKYFQDQLIDRSKSAAQAGVYMGDVAACSIYSPPLEVQRQIADYLDAHTAKIDLLIGKQERLIEMLAERRTAVISHAVTKGLDPNAPTKDSGLAWLGSIPIHWDIRGSRRVFRHRNTLALPSDVQLTASQDFGVIEQDRYVRLTGNRVVTVQKGFDILKKVERGDFVISMRSFQGGLEYAHAGGKISSAYVSLAPIEPIVDQYFAYLFKSSPYVSALRATSNLVRDGQALRYSNFAQVQIPVPPDSAQLAIARFLDRETAQIDALSTKAREMIDVLKERRQALISAAVTGKIDVRGLA